MGSSFFTSLVLGMLFFSQPQERLGIKEMQSEIHRRVALHYNQHIVAAHVTKNGSTFLQAGSFASVPQEAIFEIGSITKLFTAHLTLLLAKEGALSLDAPATSYLPRTVKLSESVTIRHLLTHTSGIKDPAQDNYYNPENGNTVLAAEYSIENLCDYLSEAALEFTPGTQILYSNLGYGLMGYILERVSGQDYYSLLNKKILEPLKMHHTFLDIPAELYPSLVRGWNGSQVMPLWEIKELPAFASLKSTAQDLATYLQQFLLEEHSLMDQEIREQLTEVYLKREEMPISVGIGWTVDERYGGRFHAATGRTLGASSFMGLSLEKGEGFILLTDASSLDYLGHHWFNPLFPLQTLYEATPLSSSQLQKFNGEYTCTEELDFPSLLIEAGSGFLEMRLLGENPLLIYPAENGLFFPRYFDETARPVQFFSEDNKPMQMQILFEDKQLTFVRNKKQM